MSIPLGSVEVCSRTRSIVLLPLAGRPPSPCARRNPGGTLPNRQQHGLAREVRHDVQSLAMCIPGRYGSSAASPRSGLRSW
jgi:hypothetical protein